MRLHLAAIALLLLSFSPPQTNAATTLVDGVCKSTSNYNDCVSAIGLDPRSASASDLKALAGIILETAAANTTKGKAFIEDLAKDTSTAPSAVTALKQCASDYGASVNSFNIAKEELSEDLQTANYDAKVAGDGADTCDAALKSSGSDVPSVAARNSYLRLYSSIGFVVTNQLGG